MKTLITVIKKELKNTLRDKRTLFSAIILPATIIPLLCFGMFKFQKHLAEKEREKELKIMLIEAPDLIKTQFQQDKTFKIVASSNLKKASDAVAIDSLDAVIAFSNNFNTDVSQLKSGKINVYYKSTNLLLYNRIVEKIDVFKSQLLNDRVNLLKVPAEIFTPIVISKIDVASQKEQLGKMLGGFLPYFFILFCFFGCMYPALDMITGEKEQGTLETLLTVPASRFKILMGKMVSISLIGLSAALLTILGFGVGLKFLPDVPKDVLISISNIVSTKFVLMLFVMLVPLSVFFSGLLSITIMRAKSFKEAQSIVTPMAFLVLIPASIALAPGVVLNWQTAWIPILNIALACKEIISGTILTSQYVSIVISLIVLGVVAVYLSCKQFAKEDWLMK